MSEENAIVLKNIGMKFNLSKEKVDSLKDYVIKSLRRQIEYNEFWALKDVSLTIKKGDRVGILGFNGAGKSTIFKEIASLNQRKERWKSMEKLHHFWSWELVSKSSIPEKKISICMEQCLDIVNSLLMKNTMR